ncbi:MAG: cell division protein FtsQ/DivIB [Alphaproteobacteria bacterium]|nr:cell division protein FtsQ/DivIB [Alphaproteobacteria bacterium]
MRSLKEFLQSTEKQQIETSVSLDRPTPQSAVATTWSWRLRPLWSRFSRLKQINKRIYLGIFFMVFAILIGTGWLMDLWFASGRLIGAFSAKQGFELTEVKISGRLNSTSESLRKAINLQIGMPLIAIDLHQVKSDLEKLAWVKSVKTVSRIYPGLIFIEIEERTPVAIWQYQGKFSLIDTDGQIIPVSDVQRFANLMVIVGENAPQKTPELIKMLSTQSSLQDRVTAAIWVGDRRWDLRIDNRIEVILPEEGATDAWLFLAQKHQEQRILDQPIKRIDLRIKGQIALSFL